MPSIYINESDISGSDQIFISNIYSGKILGEIMRLQDKSITITENGTTSVTYDSDYTGLGTVNITTNVPNPSTGTISITENANQINVKDYEFADVAVPGISLLDKTVTFKNGTDNYQVVTVTNGQTVSAPNVNPTPSTGIFQYWEINGSQVTFPYTPNSDVTMTAHFSQKRSEMEITEAGTVLATRYSSSVTKVNAGWCILGVWETSAYASNRFVTISDIQSYSEMSNYRESFTMQYNATTYYIYASYVGTEPGWTMNEKAYNTTATSASSEYADIAKALLDRYFLVT